MLENCKTCLFYDAMYDEICRQHNDEDIINDPNTDKHFCDMWDDNEEVIPKEVWESQTKCKYYVKNK